MIVTCSNCGAKNRINPERARSRQPVCGRCGQALAVSEDADPGHPIEVSDSNFADVLASAGEKPVLIDFWAEWCPPCRMLAPIIEQLATEAGGRYVVGKLDTDANQMTAGRFNISGLPTMLIFRRGEVVEQLVGLRPKEAIAQALARHM